MTIDGVDSLFEITNSILAYVSVNLWRRAFISVVLSSVFWSLPLVTIFAPSSLTTRSVLVTSQSETLVPHFYPSHQETAFFFGT